MPIIRKSKQIRFDFEINGISVSEMAATETEALQKIYERLNLAVLEIAKEIGYDIYPIEKVKLTKKPIRPKTPVITPPDEEPADEMEDEGDHEFRPQEAKVDMWPGKKNNIGFQPKHGEFREQV